MCDNAHASNLRAQEPPLHVKFEHMGTEKLKTLRERLSDLLLNLYYRQSGDLIRDLDFALGSDFVRDLPGNAAPINRIAQKASDRLLGCGRADDRERLKAFRYRLEEHFKHRKPDITTVFDAILRDLTKTIHWLLITENLSSLLLRDETAPFLSHLRTLCNAYEYPHLVLLSGGLTHRGTADEFKRVTGLLAQLRRGLHAPNGDSEGPLIVPVPGIGDVKRPRGIETFEYYAVDRFRRGEHDFGLQEVLWDARDASLIDPLFAPYREWFESQLATTYRARNIQVQPSHFPGDYWIRWTTPNDVLVSVFALNTVWTCFRENDERAMPRVALQQIHEPLRNRVEASTPDLAHTSHAIILQHHAPWELRDRNYLEGSWRACFHGMSSHPSPPDDTQLDPQPKIPTFPSKRSGTRTRRQLMGSMNVDGVFLNEHDERYRSTSRP